MSARFDIGLHEVDKIEIERVSSAESKWIDISIYDKHGRRLGSITCWPPKESPIPQLILDERTV